MFHGAELLQIQQLTFEQPEEIFYHSIVQTVSLAAHALANTFLPEHLLVLFVLVLKVLCSLRTEAMNPIETSFRNLKHTLGLLHLHAKKVEFVLQEIFAKLTMYNFCELITQSVVIRQAQKTHTYKVNFSDAVHICRQFFLGDVPPPILEAMLMRYISPIRPGRKDTRKLTQKSSASFTYRVA